MIVSVGVLVTWESRPVVAAGKPVCLNLLPDTSTPSQAICKHLNKRKNYENTVPRHQLKSRAMETFITILAVFFILISGARIFFVISNDDPETEMLVLVAERLGGDPVGEALKWPVITFIVSLAWLISLIFN